MFQIQAPIVIIPTLEARSALGRRLRWAGLDACREIAIAAKGVEIAHLQFAFVELRSAGGSRVRPDGVIEIDLGNPNLPARSLTAAQIRLSMAAARTREAPARRNRQAGRTERTLRGCVPPPSSITCGGYATAKAPGGIISRRVAMTRHCGSCHARPPVERGLRATTLCFPADDPLQLQRIRSCCLVARS